MNIKIFKIKNMKIQKIRVIVVFSVLMAIFLIGSSFVIVFNNQNKKNEESDIFKANSYYTKYQVVTYSNKNQNTYIMEEYYLKENDEKKYRFNTMNKDTNYSYIVLNNTFSIKSDEQKNNYINLENIQKNNMNILSISTFVQIYNDITSGVLKGISIETKEKDNIFSYIILLNKEKYSSDVINQYIEKLGINKMELMIDKNTGEPVEYVVYNKNENTYIDIMFSEFQINKKIDEKVFSF